MAEADAQRPHGVASLRRAALRGSVVIVGAYAGRETLRLAANLVVSRMLTPEAYGLMAIVNALIGGMQMFSDIGLNFSVIQSARGSEPRFLGTVWSLQIVRGVALCLLTIVVAPAVAYFYDDPRLTSLLAVCSLGTALTGLRSVAQLHDQRTLRQGWVMGVELGSMAAASVAMVIWAWLDASVWALAGGSLVGSLAQVAISHAAPTARRIPLMWDRSAIREIVGFGKWVFVSTLMLYLAQQSDRLIFGRLESLSVLGVYNIATVLVSPPVIVMNRLGGAIAFPALARARESARDFAAAYVRARRPLVTVGGVLVSLLVAGGPRLIELLYDSRWHGAGPFLQWLALQTWFRVLSTAPAAALLAMGLSRFDALANVVKVAAIPAGIAAGFAIAGFQGAVAGFALAEIARWACYVVICRAQGLQGAWADLGATVGMLASGGMGVLAGSVAEHAGASKPVTLAVISLVVAATWVPSIWRLYLTEVRGNPGHGAAIG